MILLIVVSVWKHVGYAVIIPLAGLKGIPADLQEAARLDGARSRQIVVRIILPLLRGPVTLVIIMLTLADLNTVEIQIFTTRMASSVMGISR